VQKAEKELEDAVMKHSTEETISHGNRPQTISMSYAERLASYFHESRLLQAYHSEFLEIAVCPYIVIALEKVNLHTPVHQRSQGREHPDISLRDHIPVFIPEIPYVAEEIERLRFLRQRVQE